jgi:RimJ/RimL family protein N-acetyltransferase
VRRDYWNVGIGSQMLAYLLEWAQHTTTVRKINLRVRVDNLPAIHLYEKFGFVKEGRVTRELYVHDQFVDAYVMGLELDPPQG